MKRRVAPKSRRTRPAATSVVQPAKRSKLPEVKTYVITLDNVKKPDLPARHLC